MSRWVELYATSPSGKCLFVCRMCGRITPSPDRTCPSPPTKPQSMTMPCEMLEEIEDALVEEGETEKKEFPVLEIYMKGNEGTACLRGQDGIRSYIKVEKRNR